MYINDPKGKKGLSIQNYLDKFSQKIQEKRDFRDQVISIIEEEIKVKIPSKDIEIEGNKLKLKVRPIIKSEIFLKRSKIIPKLKELGITNIN